MMWLAMKMLQLSQLSPQTLEDGHRLSKKNLFGTRPTTLYDFCYAFVQFIPFWSLPFGSLGFSRISR